MEQFDYIIIGAGAAGCVMAHRLSASRDCTVLLLEAGGDDRALSVRIPAGFPQLFRGVRDWNYRAVPEDRHDGRAIYLPRGKMLGGSTSMNAQIYTPAPPEDWDAWAAHGCAGWHSRDVQRTIDRLRANAPADDGVSAQRHYSTLRSICRPTEDFLDAAQALGYRRLDVANPQPGDSVGPCLLTQHRGRRWSAADTYLRPALRRQNLRVCAAAHAERLLISERRAVGVEYRIGGHAWAAMARREVIVCAGAYESPALLMRSGIGPSADLRALGIPICVDAPEVGSGLQDHPMVVQTWEIDSNDSLLRARGIGALLSYLFRRRGPLTSNIAEALAFSRSPGSTGLPDIEQVFAPATYDVEHPPREHGVAIGSVLLSPRSRGRVKLVTTDPFSAPHIEGGYLEDDADAETMLLAVKEAQRIAAAMRTSRGDLRPLRSLEDTCTVEAVRKRVETIYHPAGTCRLGADSRAVVDLHLRVRGIDGLRVVDASVMPILVRAHPQDAIMLIAEHAYRMMAEQA